MDDDLSRQLDALADLLGEFQRGRQLAPLGVPALVAEHRECYLWDRKLRVHARVLPPHAPREVRRKLDYQLAANTRHLNAIEAMLLARGSAGVEGVRTIFWTPDLRYRLRVMDEAVRLFPMEAERGFEEMLVELRDDPHSPYAPELLERALEQLRANRLAPALSGPSADSLAPTLSPREKPL